MDFILRIEMNKCPVCQSEGFVEQCLQCGWYVQPQWSEDEKQLRLQERIDIWYEDEIEFPDPDQDLEEEHVPPNTPYPMRRIEGCSFTMGSPVDEEGRDPDEQQHRVTVSQAFWIGLTEVPQDLWMEVQLHNPSIFFGTRRPADSITWFDAIHFCNRYSKKMGLESAYKIEGEMVVWNREANGFRLPTEAEWELSSRISRAEHFEDPNYAWFQENSDWSTRSISVPSNGEFLDFAGNVWEWCWDYYEIFTEDSKIDPIGPSMGKCRVLKGGSYIDDVRILRPANRAYSVPTESSDSIGFRIVRNAFNNESIPNT